MINIYLFHNVIVSYVFVSQCETFLYVFFVCELSTYEVNTKVLKNGNEPQGVFPLGTWGVNLKAVWDVSSRRKINKIEIAIYTQIIITRCNKHYIYTKYIRKTIDHVYTHTKSRGKKMTNYDAESWGRNYDSFNKFIFLSKIFQYFKNHWLFVVRGLDFCFAKWNVKEENHRDTL